MSDHSLQLAYDVVSRIQNDFWFSSRAMMPSLFLIEGAHLFSKPCRSIPQTIRDVITRIVGLISTLLLAWSVPQWNVKVHLRLKIIRPITEDNDFGIPMQVISRKASRKHRFARHEQDSKVAAAGQQMDQAQVAPGTRHAAARRQLHLARHAARLRAEGIGAAGQQMDQAQVAPGTRHAAARRQLNLARHAARLRAEGIGVAGQQMDQAQVAPGTRLQAARKRRDEARDAAASRGAESPPTPSRRLEFGDELSEQDRGSVSDSTLETLRGQRRENRPQSLLRERAVEDNDDGTSRLTRLSFGDRLRLTTRLRFGGRLPDLSGSDADFSDDGDGFLGRGSDAEPMSAAARSVSVGIQSEPSV